jgi:anti-sigma B factor antagonist
MEINEQRQGAVTVLKPQGPLVAQDAEQFKDKLAGVLATSLGRFVVDASEIPYVDSRGLEVLKEATEQLSDSGQALRLCGANETVREVLDITDLSKLFEHYQDVNSAVRSFL